VTDGLLIFTSSDVRPLYIETSHPRAAAARYILMDNDVMIDGGKEGREEPRRMTTKTSTLTMSSRLTTMDYNDYDICGALVISLIVFK